MLAPSEAIVVELAGAPEGAGRPRFSRHMGIAYTPTKTRSYQSDLRLAGQDAMAGRPPVDAQTPLRVLVVAMMPIPASWSAKKRARAIAGELRPTTKPDADNLLKQCDALNQVVWVDDKQIVEAAVSKFYSERPALRIEVRAA